MANQTVTITFAESVENHAGMQVIGQANGKGFSADELRCLSEVLQANGKTTELYELSDISPANLAVEEAVLLVVRDGISNADEALEEQKKLVLDKQAFMKGRVVNKKARYNLCFSDFAQEPNYEEKKGRVYNFKELKEMSSIREQVYALFGDKAKGLMAEGNYYYDTSKCYIGWHGDTERSIVIGIRLGSPFPLHYHWYHKSDPVGEIMSLVLNHGDIYVMSHKAVGNDWKKSSIPTLRHSAGHLELKEMVMKSKSEREKKKKEKEAKEVSSSISSVLIKRKHE